MEFQAGLTWFWLMVCWPLVTPMDYTDKLVESVRRNKYEIKMHYVTTEDGYILSMYNMPPRRNRHANQTKPNIMFFTHGLTATSAEFTLYRDRSLAYVLVDRGYDVWLGNTRGTYLCQNHTTFDYKSRDYWQFSWHEIGTQDLPAQIDYVLQQTNQTELSLLGHSQGTTTGMILLAERPEYNEKIKIFHAMGPTVILKHYNPLFLPFAAFHRQILNYFEANEMWDLQPRDSIERNAKILGLICHYGFSFVCDQAVGVVAGGSAPNSWYPQIMSDFTSFHPAGAGYLQFMHYFQHFGTDTFRRLDYGDKENRKRYGSAAVPEYNLANVRTKVHILHGSNDLLSMDANIPYLAKHLENAEITYSPFSQFNHFDFAFGRHVGMVPRRILKVEKKYRGRNEV